jgi:hypothetical protein
MTTKVEVRAATGKDVPVIHDMIKQLADFQGNPEKFTATDEALARTLGIESDSLVDSDITPTVFKQRQFKPGQFAKCIIAEVDEQAVGVAVFFYNYATVLSRIC